MEERLWTLWYCPACKSIVKQAAPVQAVVVCSECKANTEKTGFLEAVAKVDLRG